MFIKTIIKIFSVSYVFLILLNPTALAVNLSNTEQLTNRIADKSGYISNTGGDLISVDTVIGDIIKYFLSFLGVIFLGLLIYGGFTWMRARGDDSAVTTAKETMINAITGLIIVLGSYAATAWVVENLATSTLK